MTYSQSGQRWKNVYLDLGLSDQLDFSKTPSTEKGTGGLAELKEKLDEGQAQYAYVRVEYANDTESKRVKFVLVIWIGENTKVMRKARVSIESGVWVGKSFGGVDLFRTM